MLSLLLSGSFTLAMGGPAPARQLTHNAKNHDLDNNDNFSPCGQWLCYDTRETVGPGIDFCQSVEMVHVPTGREVVLYRPGKTQGAPKPAPGVGAVSFSGAAMEAAFIHGPPVDEVAWRGPYGKPNRNGARVRLPEGWENGEGPFGMQWLDHRDIASDRDTLPGAHRGGTHRHEYTLDGTRIGFTYDDFLMPEYDRTIGYMEPHPGAPGGASHYFALLVRVVPKGTAEPGEIEKAYGDSWVGRDGSLRAFIGKVRESDGTYQESLFTVEIPEDADITTADAGSATRFPSPPEGLRVRRLTHAWAGGIVRGAHDGSRIAYYGKDANGETQVFVIPSAGSDQHEDPAMRPRQATSAEGGVESGLRWHPSGTAVVYIAADNAVMATRVSPGPRFGETRQLTPAGGRERTNLVVSPDGKTLAYNQLAPAPGPDGAALKTYAGLDWKQIFLLDFDISQ